jgi:thiol-disulfide isomerase/thioredoxin
MRTSTVLALTLLLLAPVAARAGDDPLAAGAQAPALVLDRILPGSDGATTCDFAGKVTLVEFWFTKCGPCRQAIPHVNKLVRSYGSRGFQAISVTFDDEATVRAFTDKVPIESMIGLDTSRQTIGAYGISSYPTSILVGQDGTILAVTRPDAITDEVIENALAGRAVTLAPSTMSDAMPAPEQPATEVGAEALAHCTLRESGAMGRMSVQMETDVIRVSGFDKRMILQYLHLAAPDLCDIELGPDDRIYDFEARLQGARAGQLLEIARNFLAGVWDLEVSREERAIDVAVVSLAGTVKGVREWNGTERGASRGAYKGMPLSVIVSDIAHRLGVHGIDETGDTTFYDFEVAFDAEMPIEPQALETFRLKVVRERRPVEFLVVRQRGAAQLPRAAPSGAR